MKKVINGNILNFRSMENSFPILITLAVICFASCNNNDLDGTQNDFIGQQNIFGCWGNPSFSDNAEGRICIYYERTNALSDDGIEFLKNGSLTERKIAGWCGTPPVIYSNYSGKWHVKDERIIMDVPFWGGIEHKIWRIIDITETTLKIEVLLQEYDK